MIKLIKAIKLNDIIIISIAVLAFIVFYIYTKNKNSYLKNYIGKYDYGIGRVEYFFHRSTIKNNLGHTSIKYSYTVNGQNYTKSYKSSFYSIPSDIIKGENYLIIYNSDNPQNSILFGDYIISDINNFKTIVENFENDSSIYFLNNY